MLANYATNSARTNHYILTYFKRLSSSRTRGGTISSTTNATDDDSGPTLEPLLYNIHTLSVFAALLEDPLIRLGAAKPTVDPTAKGGVLAEADGAPELRRLARYAADITRNFAALCATNRLACVEALFLHQHPRSFIEELTGGYGASTFEKFIAAEDAVDDEVTDFEESDDDDVAADVAGGSSSGASKQKKKKSRRQSAKRNQRDQRKH
eukprot:12871-Heterococcus_DN1.PRE.2